MLTKEIVQARFEFYYEKTFRKLDEEGAIKYGERYTATHKWRTIEDVLLISKYLTVQNDDKVLEIGPSMTSLLLRDLIGVKIETLCIDEMNRNFLDKEKIPVHLCDICKEVPPLEKESFDAIIFAQVFEHFTLTPEFALKNILNLLKPGKKIFFCVPNFATSQHRLTLLRGGNPQDLLSDKIVYFAHLREPCYYETNNWWQEAGGTILKIGWTNYNNIDENLFSNLKLSFRYVKEINWHYFLQIWYPRMRHYYYSIITK